MPEINQLQCLEGCQFREMVAAGSVWLEKNAPAIDAINVFPVPDGDTGTNMLLTMRSAVEESYRAPDGSASAIGNALAHGALMGARGNSGVILSQVLRGIAQSLEGRHSIHCTDIAHAFKKGSDQAYKGVARPVEGTMLTVMRDVADAAAAQAAAQEATAEGVLEAAVNAARESVARTPLLLPALREAGVVDAGGQGLLAFLEGALYYLRGDRAPLDGPGKGLFLNPVPLALRVDSLSSQKEEPYGYCTEFIIEGQGLDANKVMSQMNRKGQSVVVVGDENMVRVHVHTLDPGAVLHYALSKGKLHHIKIENMDEQHKGFVQAAAPEKAATGIAIVAVAPGPGLAGIFKSLGTACVIHGGQTMNPSVRDMLKAVESTGADEVILLPNNKNVVQCAAKVPSLTSRKVVIVPTSSIPQGIAALMAFNFEQGTEENASTMLRQAGNVKTVEITIAARSTRVGGIEVRKGQIIGLLDDCLVAAGDAVVDVMEKTLAKAVSASAELVTLYYGSDVCEADAKEAKRRLSLIYTGLEFEVVEGGQPHYYYIVSVE